jgi:hypothetical protein
VEGIQPFVEVPRVHPTLEFPLRIIRLLRQAPSADNLCLGFGHGFRRRVILAGKLP